MRAAILSTPANIEIARKFIDQFQKTLDLTLYFKRGNVYQKQNNGTAKTGYNYLKMKMVRDIRKERFDQFIVVELPQARVKLLPYYALVAFFSNASEKSVLLKDGTCIPLTRGLLIRLTGKLISLFLKLLAVLPVVVVNLTVVIFVSVIVDLWIVIRSRLAAG